MLHFICNENLNSIKISKFKFNENLSLRLNGVMTVRNAINLCETDNNCAGFTYKGPIYDLDEYYDIYFFS